MVVVCTGWRGFALNGASHAWKGSDAQNGGWYAVHGGGQNRRENALVHKNKSALDPRLRSQSHTQHMHAHTQRERDQEHPVWITRARALVKTTRQATT